ncbi:MAG: bifunctional response regulator/alkaline phosphatase family protein [Candidatus Marinimicrobia bacterium]|nr:bifunctional response regulator/alkaline phosphatase family protein [Candidatus Neomarinimicrobiota bacterium]MCF7840498.1 bifunctional response regulator/alkaline phosphatase family protein [Candidatus Neomarinimicrobiota bacterium]
MNAKSHRARILWTDDEIDLLKPHILFLKQKGFDVLTATNGEDAITLARQQPIDIVLLDEMMQGKDGLETLSLLKEEHPALPVIMITKNEEESLMEEAIGGQIADYLTKPVNPSQILSAIMKHLEKQRISRNRLSQRYIQALNELSDRLSERLAPSDWINIYHQLTQWELDLTGTGEAGLDEMLAQQIQDADNLFSRFIMREYEQWVNAPSDERPTLSPDVFRTFVKPRLSNGKKVLLVVMDGLRWDQWLTLESQLHNDFKINRHGYFSLLPTTTEYSRNAIFSGLFPDDMARFHPEWFHSEEEVGLNQHEREFLIEQLHRLGLEIKPEPKYAKVITAQHGQQTVKQFSSWSNQQLVTLVVNQVDILAHQRTNSTLLQDLLPNEASYRQVVRAWFENSWLFDLMKEAARHGFTTLVTSDHGTVRVKRPTQIKADREASVNLRFKQGRNLKANPRDAWFINDPKRLRIPSSASSDTLAIALSDFYFLYPTNYRKYQNRYMDTYQHGGLSMAEMIIPFVTLEPK